MMLEDREALEAAKKLQQYCNGRLCNHCIFHIDYGCELDCDPESYELDNINDE